MNIKALIPKSAKVLVRRSQRIISDYSSGQSKQFAQKRSDVMPVFEHRIMVEQPIMPSAFFENKVWNMQKASERINQVMIMPGEIFSFWAVLGYPSAWKGYRKGRNLVAGKIESAYGGGLCQVSSIIYFIALGTGLEIVERHNHSVDIYAENERFTPLGADATVVYGYKDLRIRNTTEQPLRMMIDATTTHLKVGLHSPIALDFHEPAFERQEEANHRIVCTKIKGAVVAISKYRTP